MSRSRVPDACAPVGRRRARRLASLMRLVVPARLAGLVLAAVAACLAVAPATALASTAGLRPQQAGPVIARSLLAGMRPNATTPVKTITASYSCDFSHYGGTQPVTVATAWEVATSWPVGQPDDVLLATDAITLPSGVSLGSVTSFSLSADVTVQKASAGTVTVAGGNVESLPSPLTEIPLMLALGQVTFPAKGTGVVLLPAKTITITPHTTSAQPAITCTTTTKATDVSVTVGNASGSFYNCTATVAGAGSLTSAGAVAMTFSSSGTKKTGHSVTITLGSSDIASLISGFNGSGVTQAVVSADLAVTGAQSGKLHMSKKVTDLSATSFSMSGSLKLTKAGTVKIDIPSDFGVALAASGTTVLDLSCSLVTKPAPVALTLTVTQGSSSSSPTVCTTPTPTTTVTPTVTVTPTTTVTVTPTPTTSNGSTTVTPTATVTPTTTVTPTVTVTPTTTASPTPCASSGGSGGSGGSEEGSGTPVGGVNTGGGVAPGANVALGIGGAALLLAGGGLVLRATRRGAFATGTFASWWRRVTRGR